MNQQPLQKEWDVAMSYIQTIALVAKKPYGADEQYAVLIASLYGRCKAHVLEDIKSARRIRWSTTQWAKAYKDEDYD